MSLETRYDISQDLYPFKSEAERRSEVRDRLEVKFALWEAVDRLVFWGGLLGLLLAVLLT